MIERLTIENFKSLKRVDLTLGPLNIFIGPNASGKSNLFDALRVLQGLGYGFTVSEIFDGKPKSATSIEWHGIRGGSALALSRIGLSSSEIRLTAHSRLQTYAYLFEVGLDPLLSRVIFERLFLNGEEFSKNSDALDVKSSFRAYAYEQFGNMQQFNFDLAHLREYSQPQTVTRLGEHGENFAALVNALISNPKTRTDYMSWLSELVPAEIDNVEILKGAVGEPLFAIRNGFGVFPAFVLSDGTLRFAALTAALFQPDAPRLALIEEIETGIHPSRLQLLLELLRSRAARGQTQLFVTTHSPIILDWLTPADYATTFLCQRGADGASHVLPLSKIPRFAEVAQRTPASELFVEGWLETVA